REAGEGAPQTGRLTPGGARARKQHGGERPDQTEGIAMSLKMWQALGVVLLCGVAAAAEPDKKPQPAKDVIASFGTLQAPPAEPARKQAEEWLASVGKTDAATKAKFAAVWDADRPLLDKVADTLALGDQSAAALLAEARDANKPAPEKVPALIKDQKVNAY